MAAPPRGSNTTSGADAAIAEIRALLTSLRRRWPELPVIMLTGVGDIRGAFGYVQKPFE